MRTIVFVTVLALAIGVAPAFGEPEKKGKNLIKVVPSYQEAAFVPSKTGQAVPANAVGEPTPRDQMYVFWILGKALSYPIDKVESMVTNWRNKSAEKAVATPAASSATPNPFDAVKLREIPPAPPALESPRNAKAARGSQ